MRRLSLSVVRKYAPIRWCALNREHDFDPAHRIESNSHTQFLGVKSDRKKSLFQRSDMEDNAVLLHESVIRGHHIYKRVWSPRVGEIVSVDCEHRNTRSSCCLSAERKLDYRPCSQRTGKIFLVFPWTWWNNNLWSYRKEKAWKRPGSSMRLHVRWQGKEYREVERTPSKEKY